MEYPLQFFLELHQYEGSDGSLEILHYHHLQHPVERPNACDLELDAGKVDNPEVGQLHRGLGVLDLEEAQPVDDLPH